jgi:hypothetical protein
MVFFASSSKAPSRQLDASHRQLLHCAMVISCISSSNNLSGAFHAWQFCNSDVKATFQILMAP